MPQTTADGVLLRPDRLPVFAAVVDAIDNFGGPSTGLAKKRVATLKAAAVIMLREHDSGSVTEAHDALLDPVAPVEGDWVDVRVHRRGYFRPAVGKVILRDGDLLVAAKLPHRWLAVDLDVVIVEGVYDSDPPEAAELPSRFGGSDAIAGDPFIVGAAFPSGTVGTA